MIQTITAGWSYKPTVIVSISAVLKPAVIIHNYHCRLIAVGSETGSDVVFEPAVMSSVYS